MARVSHAALVESGRRASWLDGTYEESLLGELRAEGLLVARYPNQRRMKAVRKSEASFTHSEEDGATKRSSHRP